MLRPTGHHGGGARLADHSSGCIWPGGPVCMGRRWEKERMVREGGETEDESVIG